MEGKEKNRRFLIVRLPRPRPPQFSAWLRRLPDLGSQPPACAHLPRAEKSRAEQGRPCPAHPHRMGGCSSTKSGLCNSCN
uniref:Uncharacterized protein n=1 Tax=Leersia perrieri TaxID=77586 RepID=A0A0D9XHR4_9ORYZ